MALPQGFLDELRDRVSVSSVVGRRHQLIRKGREYVSLCPFHSDSKPSLNIVDDKGFYHCFACGAHGDVIKFVMESEGLGFMEAVEQLAAQAGLDVPKETPEDRQKAERRRTLQDVVDLACRWYERQLRTAAGDEGLRYLRDRGLTDETIATFRLGWAPEDRKALQRAMKAEGVEVDALVEAGLVKRYDDGPRAGETGDYMRGRVLFPITDRRGGVIAFGGRVLGDGQPKYLNSPDTPLFHKGRVLYGLAQAREAAHKSGTLVVAEGYMDVIALAQAGVPAVAPLGTALTEDQIAVLWKMVPEPIVCFDGDSAGQRAAARACERALPMLAPGHSLRFVALPEGEDPDSLTRRDGPAGFRKLLEAAEPMGDFLWHSLLSSAELDTPEKRANFKKSVNEKAKLIADRDVQEEYWRFFQDKKSKFFDIVNRSDAGFRKSPGYTSDPRIDYYVKGHFDGSRGKPYDPIIRFALKHGPQILDKIETARRKVRADEKTVKREKLMIATIASHPALLDEYDEILGFEHFSDPNLEDARQSFIDYVREYPSYTYEEIRGFISQYVDKSIFNDKAMRRLFSFCREDAPLDIARKAWDQLYKRDRMARIDEEIQQMIEAVGDDFDPTDYEVIEMLIVERERLRAEVFSTDIEDLADVA